MALPDSLFVSSAVVAREVELADGSIHTLHFRPLPAVEFRKFQLAEASDNPDVKAMSVARIIAASLCEEDGRLALTVERAAQLSPSAANSIMLAILAVNGFDVDPKKD